MSVIQSGCKRSERCVIGHPFNPPRMIPFVEVVGDNRTKPEAIQTSNLILYINRKELIGLNYFIAKLKGV